MEVRAIQLPADLRKTLEQSEEERFRQSIHDHFHEVHGFNEEQMNRAVVIIKDTDNAVKTSTHEGEAIGGMVKATVDYDGKLLKLHVDKALLNNGQEGDGVTETNQDLISRGAHNAYTNALAEAKVNIQERANRARKMLWDIHVENCKECSDKENCPLQQQA